MTNPDSHRDSTRLRPLRGRDKGRPAARIGIALILLSGMLWFSLFAIPFLPLTLGQKNRAGWRRLGWGADRVVDWCGARGTTNGHAAEVLVSRKEEDGRALT